MTREVTAFPSRQLICFLPCKGACPTGKPSICCATLYLSVFTTVEYGSCPIIILVVFQESDAVSRSMAEIDLSAKRHAVAGSKGDGEVLGIGGGDAADHAEKQVPTCTSF